MHKVKVRLHSICNDIFMRHEVLPSIPGVDITMQLSELEYHKPIGSNCFFWQWLSLKETLMNIGTYQFSSCKVETPTFQAVNAK